ncbi:MAG: ABC transporter permease [Armatimonadota bacterium]|nr:ABC transporter permease [Armatimonadota bacterium]MDR7427691.1 ABC transporter permease [Armatimonadota bacterium]MDR7463993.1 ABC transporter permease [Armatimonadota bacterium]MDR7470282.1 ABC transporter permease [Armatimonadota bacterium]MDR7475381.1 ABC transporter permease [Armatimonadota bacterium]
MNAVRVLARWDTRAVLRDRWFISAAVAFGALTLAAAALALASPSIAGLSSFDRITATLIHLTMLFAPLLGLTAGAGWIAGERESGALIMLLSQPLQRAELFAGKYLGVARALLAAVLTGFGSAGVLLAARVGSDQLPAFLWLVVLALLLALASLSLGFLLSAAAPNRSRALGEALLAWLVLVIVSDLGILGTALILRLPAPVVLVLAALNPVSAFRMAAILGVSGTAELLGPVGLYAAERLGPVGLLAALCAVLVCWAVGAYYAARLRFEQVVET